MIPTVSAADLSIVDLQKNYDGPTGVVTVLRGVNLELHRGDSVAITGPSGSGKSTLLYIVGALDQQTSGTLRAFGIEPAKLTASEQARFRNEHVGFIFQDHHLLPQLSVIENVLIPLVAGTGVTADDEQRARALLDRVGLGHRVDHRPAQLSGGERQRVAVCRALINEPKLLLADEPTGNLDQKTAQAVGSLLLELSRERNVLLLCVTHSNDLAQQFGKHYELRDGLLELCMPSGSN